jgi:hypothetical protein
MLKCHLYDPDLNPGYAQLAGEFSTAVVPARPPDTKKNLESVVFPKRSLLAILPISLYCT